MEYTFSVSKDRRKKNASQGDEWTKGCRVNRRDDIKRVRDRKKCSDKDGRGKRRIKTAFPRHGNDSGSGSDSCEVSTDGRSDGVTDTWL